MVHIDPVRRALVPVDSEAARRVSAPNYDEFQGDEEIWAEIRARPECVLGVTMAHCGVPTAEEILAQDTPESLALAERKFRELREGGATRTVSDALFVYEIQDPSRPGVRQIGLGGMARTGEIRTEENPDGPIVRNEGIREEKARGRAHLVERTRAFIGTVNLAVEDPEDRLQAALESYADARPPELEARDERGCLHRVHLVTDGEEIERFEALLAAEDQAYVADGNHRSAAAAMLGLPGFLGVFFCADTMGLAPYNRLVRGPRRTLDELRPAVEERFQVTPLPEAEAFQPTELHEIGFYAGGRWHRLVPLPGTWDPDNAVESVDADIVQRLLFDEVLGIQDARDSRLTFVGANRDAGWLVDRVDSGAFAYAVTLPPVTMDQFVEVCRQGRFMPPKSTWFQPKLRMGLVMALVD